ncbi:beta-carotene 15,15'-dioxygenase, Brp/Blh family [Klenkia sp. LSe6-5]|uniref:Probable beta-carotene 15,15'-dioxygenase n=1 Tax=Klenkia sesuvii TaxID=3103137 RepID=A0ABU8DWC6_9ACTN
MSTAEPGWLPTSHPGRPTRPAAPATDWARRTSTTVAVLACLLSWTASSWDGGDRGWVWTVAVVGLLAGIPHGALDHLQAARLLAARRPAPAPALLVLAAAATAYAALAAAGYLLFRALPGPALLLFLALSVLHFGAGETVGWGVERGARRAGTLVVGALVLLVPLARDRSLTGEVVAALDPAVRLPAGWAATVLLVVPAAAVLVAAALALTGRTRAAAEVTLLLVLACTTPALVALAVYFGGWHAVRHTGRLLTEHPGLHHVLRTRGVPAALGRFTALAALPTLVVLAGLGTLWAGAGTPVAAVAATLPVLAAVTVPHSLVVAWGVA